MRNKIIAFFMVLLIELIPLTWPALAQTKPKIAVFSGPNATDLTPFQNKNLTWVRSPVPVD